MDHVSVMKTDPHSYAENFIVEDHFKSQARARGIEPVSYTHLTLPTID
jgi:hypothetical protein